MKVTYIGKRINGKSLVQKFIDSSEETHIFKGLKYLRVGDCYEMEDGSMKIVPESLGRSENVDDDQVEVWRMEEQSNIHMMSMRRSNERVSKIQSFGDRSLRSMRKNFNRLSWADQKAFIDRIAYFLYSAED